MKAYLQHLGKTDVLKLYSGYNNSIAKHPSVRQEEGGGEYKHGLYILAVLWLGSGQSVLASKQDVLNNNLAKLCELPFLVFSVRWH